MDITNIPNMPTDNLYKFIALSGLFSFLFIMTLFGYTLHQVSSQIISSDRDLRNLDAEMTNVESNIHSLEQQIEIIDAKSKKYINISEKKELIDELQILIDKKDRLSTQLKGVKTLQNDYIYKNKLIVSYWDEVKSYKGLVVAILTSSLMWCIWGFTMWYLKLQRHLDKIIFNEASKKTK